MGKQDALQTMVARHEAAKKSVDLAKRGHSPPVRDAARAKLAGSLLTTSPHIAPPIVPMAALGHIHHSYNRNFSCPIPPRENRLQVPIRAGEKVFEGQGHE